MGTPGMLSRDGEHPRPACRAASTTCSWRAITCAVPSVNGALSSGYSAAIEVANLLLHLAPISQGADNLALLTCRATHSDSPSGYWLYVRLSTAAKAAATSA